MFFNQAIHYGTANTRGDPFTRGGEIPVRLRRPQAVEEMHLVYWHSQYL